MHVYVSVSVSVCVCVCAVATAARAHSQNGSKTTRIYTDSRRLAECVENDKDL